MNIISKKVEEKLNKNRLLDEQKKRLKNTVKFSKNFDIKIIYSKIDWVTLKITNLNQNLSYIKENIKIIHTFDYIFDKNTDITKLHNTKIIFNKFIIVFAWLTFWNQKLLYDIYDFSKNKIWQIVFKNEINIKTNKNVINSLQLSWLFFKCYDEHFLELLNYFWISDTKQDIIKRIDYCIDIKWIEVFEILQYLKQIHKKSKSHYWLTATDKKILLKNKNSDLKYWTQEIYKKFSSEHNTLVIYDKILDILDNYFKRKVNWINPYQSYLDSDLPILRIEYRKTKFKNLTDNSISWVFQNIEALFFDYLLRYFDIDLSLYQWVDKTLNWKKIFLAKEEKSKKFYHSLTMFLAYANNLKEMVWENEFYKIIFKNFPNIESTNSLKLLDEFETHELLAEIFPKK